MKAKIAKQGAPALTASDGCLSAAMRDAVTKLRYTLRDKRGTRAVRKQQSEATARALAACAAHARSKPDNEKVHPAEDKPTST